MASSDMQSAAKPHRHRQHGHRKTWQLVVLVLFVGVLLAAVVGLILMLNSNVFVEAR